MSFRSKQELSQKKWREVGLGGAPPLRKVEMMKTEKPISSLPLSVGPTEPQIYEFKITIEQ